MIPPALPHQSVLPHEFSTSFADVGSVVTLNSPTVLLDYKTLSDTPVAQEISRWPYVYDKENKTASLYKCELRHIGNQVRVEVHLKILGYLGDGSVGHSNLFALVSVMSD
ncbi:hypothetical protein [Paraburkholderia haematera]|jgi:hypothetical protein|uniref:Uncharacterized protein n=1 Tax=Paraburkholderia haematera TaxID=2793077 RepID=A0ABM8SHE1_9BURK|nr:hypothetical protein [Paraburkholderia haematera]CAE6809514.1 hypothetical protein R69888_05594 [Paraburkholderia haematera]